MLMADAMTASAIDRIQCDFTHGIPDTFTQEDRDGNEPSNGARKFGFEKGVAWVTYTEADGNTVASSTSWYSPAGTSDDWLLLPPLEVEDGTCLEWRARAVDSKYRDGYVVYVDDTPLLTVGDEEYAWTQHSLDLSSYAGQTVIIAFVNNSTNKSRLFIDDLFAGVKQPLVITPTSPYVVKTDSTFTLSAAVTSETGLNLTGVETWCTVDGRDFSFPYQHEGVVLGEAVEVGYHARLGDFEAHASQTIHASRQMVVCEEVTGTWCGYCVRGIVAMHQMREQHPDDFIGIAVHSGDVMQLSDYPAGTVAPKSDTNGLPDAIVNRNTLLEGDPNEIAQFYQVAKQQPLRASVTLTANLNNGNGTITAHTEVMFNETTEDARYTIAYVLVEDSVHHPEQPKDYRQHNSYAGGGHGDMGGFELLPAYISAEDMYFMDVPRAVYDTVYGVEGSLPSVTYAGLTYTHDYVVTLPTNVDHIGQTRLIAMLLDRRYNQIVNAAYVSFSESEAIAVKEIKRDPSTNVCPAFYDLQGRRLNSGSCRSGIIIVRTAKGQVVKVTTSPHQAPSSGRNQWQSRWY